MPPTPTQLTPILRRLRALSKVMDNAVTIPGTDFGVGLDPILGLVPGGGRFTQWRAVGLYRI